MSSSKVKDLSASVHHRLLNRAREQGRPFNEVLQFYAIERFLYRLSESEHCDGFILKGATLLTLWVGESSRPTRDIDLLGFMSNDVGEIVKKVEQVCTQVVEPDGLVFDPNSVEGEVIAEKAEYEGVRIRFEGNLGSARVPMQIDVGFGDVVSPPPEEIDYPTILDFPSPRLRSYARPTVIAEKFETMVRFGELNSRMKDFYDIWKLSKGFPFDGQILRNAIAGTFNQRSTPLREEPEVLSAGFGSLPEKQVQWKAFSRVSRVDDAPEAFLEVIQDLNTFLGPVVGEISGSTVFQDEWNPPGPWSRSSSLSGGGGPPEQ